jgi:hypothetical protein
VISLVDTLIERTDKTFKTKRDVDKLISRLRYTLRTELYACQVTSFEKRDNVERCEWPNEFSRGSYKSTPTVNYISGLKSTAFQFRMHLSWLYFLPLHYQRPTFLHRTTFQVCIRIRDCVAFRCDVLHVKRGIYP